MSRLGLFVLVAACGQDPTAVLDASPGDASLDALFIDAPLDAPPVPVNVTLTLPLPPLDPDAVQLVVAYQDGDGAWTRAAAPVGDDYTFAISSGRYGVMVGCVNDQLGAPRPARLVEIVYFTVAETAHLTMSLYRCGRPPTVNVHGNLANAAGGVLVWVDGSYADTSGAYAVPAREGTQDVVVIDPSTTRLLVERIEVDGDTRLDLDLANALPTTEHHIVGIVAAPGEQLATSSVLRTANGTAVALSSMSSLTFRASPVAMRSDGDRDHVHLTSWTPGGTRTFERWGGPPGDIVGSLSAPLTSVQCATDGATPYPRVLATWDAIDADRVQIRVLQPSPAGLGQGDLLVGVTRSRGHLAGATSWSFPDFTTIANWPSVYEPMPGIVADCRVGASQTAAGPAAFASMYPPDGTTIRSAIASATWTP